MLGPLEPLTQLRIGLEALLSRELRFAQENPQQPTPWYDWVFGEGGRTEEVPEPAGGE
jgi:hypothetical protein